MKTLNKGQVDGLKFKAGGRPASPLTRAIERLKVKEAVKLSRKKAGIPEYTRNAAYRAAKRLGIKVSVKVLENGDIAIIRTK